MTADLLPRVASRSTSHANVGVAVHATDPLSLAGAISELGSRAEIRLLDDPTAEGVDVVLAIAGTVSRHDVAELRAIARENAVRVVLVASRLPEPVVLPLVECGMVAVLSRAQATVDRMVATVLAAHRGDGHLPPSLLGSLLDRVSRLQREVLEPNGLTAAGLSPREVDVLRLLADGKDTAEVARELAYAERTVKKVLHGLMTRHRLRNRSHAVAFALREGLI